MKKTRPSSAMTSAKNTSRLPTSTLSRSGEPATANATTAVRPRPTAIQPYTFQRKADTRSAVWTEFVVHASIDTLLSRSAPRRAGPQPRDSLRRAQPSMTAPPIVPRRGLWCGNDSASAVAGVRDAVDASGLVVGDQKRSVGHDEHVGRAPGRGAARQPSGGKALVGRGAPVLDLHEGHPIPDRRRAVPRAVLGDEDAAAVLLGKHPAGVEPHADGGDVRAELSSRRRELAARTSGVVLWIADAVAVAERKPEVLADLRQMVQLVGRLIVAEPVAAVVGEPQVAGRRIEVEADAVAHAARHDLGPAAREVEPRDRGVERARRRADVARRADRNVELSVRAKRDELPAVMGVGRIGIAGHFGLGPAGEITRDVAEAQDAVHRADVEGAVAKRDAARRVESTGHDEHLVHSIVAVAIHERVHLARGARAHEHDAGRTDRHLAGARHGAGG